MSKIIIVPAPQQELTKQQKEFNRLTKKINKLRNEIESFTEGIPSIIRLIAEDIEPLMEEQNARMVELVKVFDAMYDHPEIKKPERKKIKAAIMEFLVDMPEEVADELISIYNKHSGSDYHKDQEEAAADTTEMMKVMTSAMFGIEFDPNADVSTPEKMQEYIANYVSEQEAVILENKQKRAANKAQKPKTAKQLEREKIQAEKEKAIRDEEKKVTKSVREVYMDLVKTFHPDLEKNEEERIRKTTIMQRVTAAYENNDLLTLLQLQMEFERIEDTHLSSLAKDRLLLFNKILRNQASELTVTLDSIKEDLSDIIRRPRHEISSLSIVDYWLKEDIKHTKKQITKIKKDIVDLGQPNLLKNWLKSYKIPKKNDFMDFFDF
jgi:hypothetical protein